MYDKFKSRKIEKREYVTNEENLYTKDICILKNLYFSLENMVRFISYLLNGKGSL